MTAHKLGVEFVRARVFLMGTERRLSYDHDTLYGIARLCLPPVKKPLLAATEANEREHIRAKSRLKKMISFGNKTRCAMQQYMDLHKVTLLAFQEGGDILPGSQRAQAKLGRHKETPLAASKSTRTEKKTVESLLMTAAKMKELAPQVVDLTIEKSQPEPQPAAPTAAGSSEEQHATAVDDLDDVDERPVSPPPAKRPDAKATPPDMRRR